MCRPQCIILCAQPNEKRRNIGLPKESISSFTILSFLLFLSIIITYEKLMEPLYCDNTNDNDTQHFIEIFSLIFVHTILLSCIHHIITIIIYSFGNFYFYPKDQSKLTLLIIISAFRLLFRLFYFIISLIFHKTSFTILYLLHFVEDKTLFFVFQFLLLIPLLLVDIIYIQKRIVVHCHS